MTRFDILGILARHPEGISCRELVVLSGCGNSRFRDFHSSLAARLRLMRQRGLVSRQVEPNRRPPHARNGLCIWTISKRGIERLEWARENGKV
jgi:hypothetical protein